MLNTHYQDRNTDELVRLVALRYIDYNSQALNITFTCNSAREQCKLFQSLFIFDIKINSLSIISKVRPFSNKRYDPKFSPKLKNQMRKLSYNRLNKL